MIVDFYIRCQKKGGGRWVHRTEIGLFSSYQQQHILQYKKENLRLSSGQRMPWTNRGRRRCGRLRLSRTLAELQPATSSSPLQKHQQEGLDEDQTVRGQKQEGLDQAATSSGAKPERNALNKQKKKNTWEVEVEQKHQQDPVAGASAEASAWTSLQSSRSNSKWSWTREGCIPGTAGSRLDQKLLWAEASDQVYLLYLDIWFHCLVPLVPLVPWWLFEGGQ